MTHPHTPFFAEPASGYFPLSDRVDGSTSPMQRDWTLAQRFGFRFVVVYVVLYTFPGPINELPGTDFLSNPYSALWRAIVPWFGAQVLRLAHPVSIQPSGSGDKLFDWVQIALLAVIALIVAIAWTIVDRRHRSHPKLLEAFTLYLRLFLARTMFSYGFDKVIPNQFSPMTPMRLTQFIGETSPGGFAWTFLGFSIAYEVDIPVKQYSAHLFLGCVFLVALDRERLMNVFLRARTVAPPRSVDLFTAPRARMIAWVAGILLAIWMVAGSIYGELRGIRQFGRLAPRGPLYGIFEVEEVVKNGAVQPPLLTDATLWRRFATSPTGALVRLATDSSLRYGLKTDTVKHIATLANGPDSTKWLRLSYMFPDSMHLRLSGRFGADSVNMKLRRRPVSSYLLVSRGFHWVNEIPFFR